MKALAIIAGVAVAAGLILAVLAICCDGVNCTIESCDLAAGRLRHQRQLFWVPTKDEVEETPLSRRAEKHWPGRPPRWRIVQTRAPWAGRFTVTADDDYRKAIEEMGAALEKGRFTAAAEQSALERFFRLLAGPETKEKKKALRSYLDATAALVISHPGVLIDESSLPRDPREAAAGLLPGTDGSAGTEAPRGLPPPPQSQPGLDPGLWGID